MKAKLYINSEESTIKAEGHYNVVLTFLAEAIAKILRGYFPHNLGSRWHGRPRCSTARFVS